MKKKKEKVIIFGASEGGKNFIKKQSEFEIVAIADNDIKKFGQTLTNYLIIAPKDISYYTYDYVIVTSMYFKPIKKQLIELGIDNDKIIAAPKSYLKPVDYPFKDTKTLEFAQITLQKITEIFNKINIKYFIDFGTLLGIVREGKLISWDDDIDLSIPSNELSKLINNLDEILLNINNGVIWKYRIVYNMDKTISNIVLDFKNVLDIKSFSIDLWVIYFEDGLAVQTMNKAPELHFIGSEELEFNGVLISVPKKYIDYLEHTYGNWRIPKSDTTFADYPFAFTK